MRSEDGLAISVKDASKRYFLNRTEPFQLMEALKRPRRTLRLARGAPFWALRDVNLDVKPGEVLGVLGANGSGKSTLLKMILGISPPTTGTVTTKGHIAGLLQLGLGFHPNATGRENAFMNALFLGLPKDEIKRRLPEMMEFGGLGEFADQPIRTYSSGMYLRLGFSVAVHVKPEILLIDEVLSVGDAEFQEKCYNHFGELKERNTTIVLVTHDLVSLESFTDRAILMEAGTIVADGDPNDVIHQYMKLNVERSAAQQRFFERGVAFRMRELAKARERASESDENVS
jgi:ABC-type polysaccharide/polyol phosphate transport system ATPase subunit